MLATGVVKLARGARDLLFYADCNDSDRARDTAFAASVHGVRGKRSVGTLARPLNAGAKRSTSLVMSAEPQGSDFVLSGPLTIDTVGATRRQMADHLACGSDVVIRAAELTRLDGAGAQLLYAFAAEVARRGGRLRWASASIYLAEAAAMLGMSDCLGLSGLPEEVTSCRP